MIVNMIEISVTLKISVNNVNIDFVVSSILRKHVLSSLVISTLLISLRNVFGLLATTDCCITIGSYNNIIRRTVKEHHIRNYERRFSSMGVVKVSNRSD